MKNKKTCFYFTLLTLTLSSGTLLASASSSLHQHDEDEQRLSSRSPLIQRLGAPSTPPDDQSNEISEQAHTLIKDDQEAYAKEKANQRALAVLSDSKRISSGIKRKREKRIRTIQKLSTESAITDIKQEDDTDTRLMSAITKALSEAATEAAASNVSNLKLLSQHRNIIQFNDVMQIFVEQSKEFLPETLSSLQFSGRLIQSSITQLGVDRPHVPEHNLKTFDEDVERLKKRVNIIRDLHEKTRALIQALNLETEDNQSIILGKLNYLNTKAIQATKVQTILNDIHHLTEEFQKI
ncbi:MAG: hypothetical protein ACTHJ4_03625 [Candidatus Nucleicultricaceae bacterium]